MLTTNPFADLSVIVPSGVMQTFVIVMIVLVLAGTLYDVIHKQSARYFSELARKSAEDGARPVSSGEKTSIAIKTLTVDVLTSAEFCNPNRRIAHQLAHPVCQCLAEPGGCPVIARSIGLAMPGNVGGDKLGVINAHHAEVRVDGRKRVIGNLGTRVRSCCQKGGFPRVRQAKQAHIGNEFQAQPDLALDARLSRIGIARRLIG